MSKSRDYKLIILGWSGAGKTSLIQRYMENRFYASHLATLGVEYKTKKIQLDGFDIKLRVWDTAGQERYNKVTNQYLKGSDGILLVYDMTNKESFVSIDNWIEQINSSLDVNEVGLVLLANKSDLKDSRLITEQEGNELAKKLNIGYFETSAKEGQNVNEAFEHLVREIMKKKSNSSSSNNNNSNGFTVGQGDKNKRKGCC